MTISWPLPATAPPRGSGSAPCGRPVDAADRAGILLGDVLLSLDGIAVSDPSELMTLLSAERVGTPATARLVRAGKVTEVTLTIGERPSHSSTEQRPPRRRGGR